jgi:2-polyprenyl-3-methyl-5-hydroxy-6-metoxy-1,4-benzoquinol methylase
MEAEIRNYFENITDKTLSVSDREAAINWRLTCYKEGRNLLTYVKENYAFSNSFDVLDIACGWGGHALAFSESGASVVANDLFDHAFLELEKFASEKALNLKVGMGDCMNIPHPDNSFDVILALELIEHISDVGVFAKEAKRVLRPNGILIMSTPPRLRSIWEGEPHYNLRGLALLPFSLQQFVGKKIFKRNYPFPIRRQYLRASSALKPFSDLGFEVEAVLISERLKKLPKILQNFLKEFHWNLLVCKKS